MPVAEFPGERNWGYDGVYISATESSYGGPDGLARLVDAAHGHGIAVILDVVYNHVGASGNTALLAFGPYHTEKYGTFWGAAMNFDDEDSDPVREWVLQSAESWVRDFHIDGLRLDAIHAIYDGGAEHLVAAISRRVHAASPSALVIAESGLNDPKVMRPAVTGRLGLRRGVGRRLPPRAARAAHGRRRGLLRGVRRRSPTSPRPSTARTSTTAPTRRSAAAASARPPRGSGPSASSSSPPTTTRSATARSATGCPRRSARSRRSCTLLSPFVPMLFMGDEYGETAPFQFFTDHIDEEIAIATRDGRRAEFASFAAFAGQDVPDPQDPATFQRSKLTRRRDAELERLHRDAIAARRDLPDGDAEIDFDEQGRWLRVRRGDRTLILNFHATKELPISATEVIVATHPVDGALPPLAGALVR